MRTRAWTIEFSKDNNRWCREQSEEGFGPHNLHQDPKPQSEGTGFHNGWWVRKKKSDLIKGQTK